MEFVSAKKFRYIIENYIYWNLANKISSFNLNKIDVFNEFPTNLIYVSLVKQMLAQELNFFRKLPFP